MKAMTMMAAAALCASVFGQVSSGNVIGFQNKSVEESGSSFIVCPTFENVGEAKTIRLTDIKVTGYSSGESPLTIQSMDGSANGKQVNLGTDQDPDWQEFTFYWYDLPGDGYPAGWYDDMGGSLSDPELNKFGICQDDITFESGAGFIIIRYDDEATLQFAGEVKKTDTKFGSFDGSDSTVVGNPFPVKCTLDQVWIEGYSSGESPLTIQPMDKAANGKQVNLGTDQDPDWQEFTFYWYDLPGDGYPAGWYDDMGGSLGDKEQNKFGIDEKEITFEAGDAYIGIRYDEDALLCFPAPKLD